MTTPIQNPRVADHPIAEQFLSRWSPRAFDDTAITRDELLSLLEAARWAPSGGNVQPWRFIYALRDDEAWPQLLGSLVPSNQVWAKNAAALVAIASAAEYTWPGQAEPKPNASHAFDAGAAWGYLALQATLSGWSAHAMGGFDKDALAKAVGLPDKHALHAVVAIGRRGDPAALPENLRARESPNARRPLAENVHHGAFPAAK